jgi:protein-tyrosine phosphatase
MLKSFFNKQVKSDENSTDEIKDFSSFGVDMHSHLIPGIDDGAKTIDDSIAMIKELHSLGFKKIITTPHIMSDFYRNTPQNILEGLEIIREAVKNNGIPVVIEAAAEYYLDDGFLQKLENEKLLTFGDNYVLFEISYINSPENMKEIIFNLRTAGYRPVLAHPERYPFWYKHFDEYKRLKDQGVYLQLNVNSLTGYYSVPAKKIGEKLIDEKMVDFIGTDTHHSKHIEVLKKCLNEKYFKKILSAHLLNRYL